MPEYVTSENPGPFEAALLKAKPKWLESEPWWLSQAQQADETYRRDVSSFPPNLDFENMGPTERRILATAPEMVMLRSHVLEHARECDKRGGKNPK